MKTYTPRQKKQILTVYKSSTSGFTLIELMISIALFGIIGITVVSLMLNSLRGSNKTTALTAVRENGDYAIAQMSRVIRPAAKITTGSACYPSSGQLSSITVTDLKGYSTIYTCDMLNSTISSNSASLLDTTAVKIVSCQFSCQQSNSADSPLINIQFSLAPATASTLAEKNVTPIIFQTSILMRNINQ